VAGAEIPDESPGGAQMVDELRTIQILCEAGLSLKQAASAVAKITGHSQRDLYQNAIRARRPVD
jgi:16S rRNA C1402 (ribose-2'-O) methylase RsmI